MTGQGVAGSGKIPTHPQEQAKVDPAEQQCEAETIKVEFGRGLTTLVSSPAALPEEQTRPAKTSARKLLLPSWFFFSADILLLAWTVSICSEAPRPLDFGTVAFSAVSIFLAALLGVAGVFRLEESS